MSEKRGALKGRIFKEGARLFAEQGYERTSLQELAGALGVTKPALYYYFSSKDELLFGIMTFVMDQVLADVIEVGESSLSPSDKLHDLIRRYISFFAVKPHELTIMSTEVDSLGPEFRETIVARQREYVQLVRGIISGVMAGRRGGKARSVNETAAVYALLGGMNWIFKWYDPAGPLSPDELARDFMSIFKSGLG
ncbi:MAG: hypothetical protein C0609_01775 [Deltaproteobacteria bacterium]|nr:MAG: hypothetical protein C0609_01775 [Deltaproteobacteria bacterium]